MQQTINFPLCLTFIRLIASPVMMPILLVLLLPQHSLWWNSILVTVFIGLCITDFLDGYLARRNRQETVLGQLLDPIADKFLVVSTILTLVYLQRVFLYWALMVIMRDFFVMGLREMSLAHGFSLTVSWEGKIKTMLQMMYIAVVIVNPYQTFDQAPLLYSLEYILCVISLSFTIFTGYSYGKLFFHTYNQRQSLI